MEIKEKDFKYNRLAREIPTYICLTFPMIIFLFVIYKMDQHTQNALAWFVAKSMIGGVSVFPALFFLMRMIVRDISSLLAENLFFPWWFGLNIFPQKMYRVLLKRGAGISEAEYDKIKNEFKDQQLDLATKDKRERKHVIEAIVSHIKNATRNDNIVFEYNIFFGFYRNMVGGLLVTLFLIIILSRYFSSVFSGVEDLIYCIKVLMALLIILCWLLMYYNDRKYALKLYRSYLRRNE